MGDNHELGLIQVYTGNGKGKSTAAFGLALRALGNGFKVYLVQFMKTGTNYGEISALLKFQPQIIIESYGRPGFIFKTGITDEDYNLAQAGFKTVQRIIAARETDLLILDEINTAVHYKLLNLQEVLSTLQRKPNNLEIVLTGRYAPPEIVEIADLVTEMREIKHPFNKGIGARKGIEY